MIQTMYLNPKDQIEDYLEASIPITSCILFHAAATQGSHFM